MQTAFVVFMYAPYPNNTRLAQRKQEMCRTTLKRGPLLKPPPGLHPARRCAGRLYPHLLAHPASLPPFASPTFPPSSPIDFPSYTRAIHPRAGARPQAAPSLPPLPSPQPPPAGSPLRTSQVWQYTLQAQAAGPAENRGRGRPATFILKELARVARGVSLERLEARLEVSARASHLRAEAGGRRRTRECLF